MNSVIPIPANTEFQQGRKELRKKQDLGVRLVFGVGTLPALIRIINLLEYKSLLSISIPVSLILFLTLVSFFPKILAFLFGPGRSIEDVFPGIIIMYIFYNVVVLFFDWEVALILCGWWFGVGMIGIDLIGEYILWQERKELLANPPPEDPSVLIKREIEKFESKIKELQTGKQRNSKDIYNLQADLKSGDLEGILASESKSILEALTHKVESQTLLIEFYQQVLSYLLKQKRNLERRRMNDRIISNLKSSHLNEEASTIAEGQFKIQLLQEINQLDETIDISGLEYLTEEKEDELHEIISRLQTSEDN